MWGRRSSKTRPSLVNPPYNASPETKDYRVVKPENWVSKLNIHTELGLCVGSSHPKTMYELTKPPCIKITDKIKIKIKLFSHIKEHVCFVIEVISFNFKDNFIIAREPLVCGIIFSNCPIVSIVQTTWIVNSGYQRVVVEKRDFVAVSDSDLERVFRKALEKLIWEYKFPWHFDIGISVVFHPSRRHISKFEKEIYLIWNFFYTLCMECH